jgi:hypothetical protein
MLDGRIVLAAAIVFAGSVMAGRDRDLMGVRLDTIRHWRSGRSRRRSDHFSTMLNLINDKRAELGKVEMELRQWLARQPSKDSKDE